MTISIEQAKSVFSKINDGFVLKNASQEEVSEAVAAFSAWSAHLIKNDIDRYLDKKNEQPFNSESIDIERDVFHAAFINRLARMHHLIDKTAPHDSESWILDASIYIAEFNIGKASEHISNNGPASFEQNLNFLKKIDLDHQTKVVAEDLSDALQYLRSKIELLPTADTQEQDTNSLR